ncbi:MAG TPA: PLP-dependent cysteine synthase family protein [Candidatus Aenigmarchaeota archaeon]|nr:PLP-dependent cysteine synthase family protein [Candidatus Aenigmarchaeota archaeon]
MKKSILDLIGNTPLIQLDEHVYAKPEFLNPTGSIKDRMVKYMIEAAEKSGELKPGYTVVEATSGNTGISLSMIASLKGYKAKIFMPETMSIERRKIMEAYGAELVLTESMNEAVKRAEELGKNNGYFYLNQFRNKNNVLTHRYTTGQEILDSMDGIDAFVAGIGTGGTIMGVGQALRERFPDVKLIGILPKDEPNRIEGIGCYYGEILKEDFLDRIVRVSNSEAFSTARELARTKGLLVGPSSGANYFVAKTLKYERVVTVLPDSGSRYLSTGLFGSL